MELVYLGCLFLLALHPISVSDSTSTDLPPEPRSATVCMSTNVNRLHTQCVLLMILLIQFHNSMQDQHYLLCPGIVEPIESPWKKLFVHTDANTFLHMTGLSRPDVKVFFAAINFPGSWADGSLTSRVLHHAQPYNMAWHHCKLALNLPSIRRLD